jgi:hypothetical protein
VTAPSVERVAHEVAAEYECRHSFPYFLTWCKIRSDDPLAPGVIPLTPWPFQVERAESWQSGTSEVILKERQLGFSAVLVAPYMLWRAMFHGWVCGYLSKGEDEAREEILRVGALFDELPSFLKVPGKVRADDATFDGGGRIIAFPSTASAGISYTLQLAVMDEASFHPYAAANFAAIQPAASRGQFLILSTADPEIGPAGFFHDIYWASKRGETPYSAVFVSRCRPDRDEDWYAKARASFAGQPERFNAYYPETDAEAFVGRSGLVYPMFSADRHVRGEHPWEWDASHRKVAGVDFGGGDPSAVVMLGMSGNQHVHQFGELYQRGVVSVYDLAAYFGQWKGPGEVLCDPSQGVAIETLDQALRGTGWRARAADNRRGEGLELVSFLLAEDRITIAAECRDSIAEFPGYRWRDRVDPNSRDRYATSTPVDHHADAMDARRYALMELLAHLRPMVTLPKNSMSGRPLARYAV